MKRSGVEFLSYARVDWSSEFSSKLNKSLGFGGGVMVELENSSAMTASATSAEASNVSCYGVDNQIPPKKKRNLPGMPGKNKLQELDFS